MSKKNENNWYKTKKLLYLSPVVAEALEVVARSYGISQSDLAEFCFRNAFINIIKDGELTLSPFNKQERLAVIRKELELWEKECFYKK